MGSRAQAPPLRLEPVVGPTLNNTIVLRDEHVVIGRSLDTQVQLPHETISRRHAAASCRAGQWFILDLGSRHGTLINGVALTPHEPAALEDGDLLSLGPWTFRVDLGGGAGLLQAPVATTIVPDAGQRVERVPDRELVWTAQQRLDLLIRASADINAAPSEVELHKIALNAARAGCGYQRAAWLRPLGGGDQVAVELASAQLPSGESPDTLTFSQSLIREAAKGQLARLTGDAPAANYGQSIVSLGIHSALCAPVMVGGTISGFLYLDARGLESAVHSMAAGFCQALAQICGLALANLRREELERRQRRIDLDLAAAREAQQLILPPTTGQFGRLRYAMRSKPGRQIAGDLLDVVPLDEHRVTVVIGDVAGKSIGAALLMATTQAYLNAALDRFQDAARALRTLNKYLSIRCTLDRFVTMWTGIVDLRTGTTVFVDAGHGHCMLVRAGQRPTPIISETGIPIAVDPEYAYAGETFTLNVGDRLVLYSDGISEQRSPSGEEFGKERVIETVAAAADPQGDVDLLFASVERHARTHHWNDDATVASFELLPEP